MKPVAVNIHGSMRAQAELKRSRRPQHSVKKTGKEAKRALLILSNLARLWRVQSLARVVASLRVACCQSDSNAGYCQWRSTTIALASHRYAARKMRGWYCRHLAIDLRAAIANLRRHREAAERQQLRRGTHHFKDKIHAVKFLAVFFRHLAALQLQAAWGRLVTNWQTSCWFSQLLLRDDDANELEQDLGLQLQQLEAEKEVLRVESCQRVETIVGLIRENQRKQKQIERLTAEISGDAQSITSSPTQRVVQVLDTITGQQRLVQGIPHARGNSSGEGSSSGSEDDEEDDEAANVLLHNPEFLKLLEAEMLTPGIALLCTPQRLFSQRLPPTAPIGSARHKKRQVQSKPLSTIEEDLPNSTSPLPNLDFGSL